MRLRQAWRAGLVGAVLLLAACAPRNPAAAQLVFASPTPDAVIGALPNALSLHFSVAIDPTASTASVSDTTGQRLAATVGGDAQDARTLDVQLASSREPTGRMTVSWQTLSADTRTPAEGTFEFTVDPRSVERGTLAQPQLAIAPALTDVGQPITVSGQGFQPGATIALTVADDGEQLGSAQADASGSFTQTPTLPGDVPFGTQPILASDPSGRKASGSIDVHWGGWPPMRVYTLAAPGPDTGQVTFTVVGRNRSDYLLEGVQVSLAIPSGAAVVSTSDGARPDGDSLVWEQGVLDRTSLTPRSVVVAGQGPLVGRATVQFRHRRASGCVGDQCLPAFVDETQSMSGPATPAP